MPRTIFWSWQSDTSKRETRDVIHDALLAAVDELAVELEEAERVEVDQGAKGAEGMVIIAEEILRKIDDAFAFVADITAVATIGEKPFQKWVPNPNVMLELGYARASLGARRLIAVFNAAIGPSRHEDLPFDLRHMSGSITYTLPEGAVREDLRRERESLCRQFVARLRAMIAGDTPSPPADAPWRNTLVSDPSIWEEGFNPLAISNRHLGRVDLIVAGAPRIFVRLLPARQGPVPDGDGRLFPSATNVLRPVVCGQSLQSGQTRDGQVMFSPGSTERTTKSIARWYRDTGELWAVSACGFYQRGGAPHPHLAHDEVIRDLVEWLPTAVRCIRAAGGEGPLLVKIGAVGLSQVLWWRSVQDGIVFSGLDDCTVTEARLADDDSESVIDLVTLFMRSLTDCFAQPALDRSQIAQSATG